MFLMGIEPQTTDWHSVSLTLFIWTCEESNAAHLTVSIGLEDVSL